jgi:hypothetical protein
METYNNFEKELKKLPIEEREKLIEEKKSKMYLSHLPKLQ